MPRGKKEDGERKTSLDLLLDQVLLLAENTNKLIKKNKLDPSILANILKNLSDALTKLEKLRNRKQEKEELMQMAQRIEDIIFSSQNRKVEEDRRKEREPIIFSGERMTEIARLAIEAKNEKNVEDSE